MGLMTTGQPAGLSAKDAYINNEIEYGGSDYTVELKRIKANGQNHFSFGYVQKLQNLLYNKNLVGLFGSEIVSMKDPYTNLNTIIKN